jgi:tyrosyl-tRNA synthetase
MNKESQINELLTRGVENIYPNKEFLEEKLKSDKQLSLYIGIDPTGPSLHLGHANSIMKLRQFQDLGHKVIMLIGSFTAMIGDPTDKSATRVPLTRDQVMENCAKYKEQASAILNFGGDNPAEIKYNHEWLDKLNFQDVLKLSSNFTVQQMLERDMFASRMKEGKPINLTEFMYPLMQGYDCVAMDVDGEIGGNDQTFNMLAGRTMMKGMLNKEKFVLTSRLLTDSSGAKMGKTTGNMAKLDDDADNMFGTIMSWADGLILPGFELCTFESMQKVQEMEQRMKDGQNPRDLKLELAESITKIYHGEPNAMKARDNFLTLFQKKEIPTEIKEYDLSGKSIIDALVKGKLVTSKSEARRMIDQNGVKVNETVINDYDHTVNSGDVVQKGKRFFIKIK